VVSWNTAHIFSKLFWNSSSRSNIIVIIIIIIISLGWGTALHAWRPWVRFPIVSLEFFIDIILPAALWPWGWLSLQQKWVLGIFPGCKDGRCIGLTTYHLHVPIVLKSLSLSLLEPSGPIQACNGICFTLLLLLVKSCPFKRTRNYQKLCIFVIASSRTRVWYSIKVILQDVLNGEVTIMWHPHRSLMLLILIHWIVI
jgi:hypothetical protein